VEGAQTPAGGRDRGDPGRRSLRRLTDRPQASEAPGTEINCINGLLKMVLKQTNAPS